MERRLAALGTASARIFRAQTLDVPENADGTGATLLATAEAHGCDLLVSGAYGHARLREMILGGVTRTLVRDCKLPLLLSH